jgi:polysaccharide biosynthesis protein PslH
MPRPQMLFVSPRFLFPADEGGKIRTSNILRQMKGGAFEIILASPAPVSGPAYLDEIQSLCDRFISWPATRPSVTRRLAALASRLPVSVATDRSQVGSAAIKDALAQGVNLVVTDFPHAAVLIPADTHPCVLFTHNVEAEIYERHARISRGLRRLVWRDQARKMARFERRVCRAHDVVIAVSERDANSLRARYQVSNVAPIVTGVDLEYFSFVPDNSRSETVAFTGVMDSPANIDGVTYFLRDIWPGVLRRRPSAQAVIVGRNPPEKLVALANVENRTRFTGVVDDIRPHLAAADVAVIPLRIGGGTRIKAFEAMAMGLPVVSTSIGVEGLGLTPDAHFLQADTAEAFTTAVVTLLENQDRRKQLASTGRALLEQRFTWGHVARAFEAICLSALH